MKLLTIYRYIIYKNIYPTYLDACNTFYTYLYWIGPLILDSGRQYDTKFDLETLIKTLLSGIETKMRENEYNNRHTLRKDSLEMCEEICFEVNR